MSETSSKPKAKETGPIPPVDDEHPDNDLSDEDGVEASELDRCQALFDEGLGYFARLVAANVELDAALDRSHAANHPSPLDDVNAALDELALALEDSRSWFQTMRFLARDTSSDALIRRLTASNGSPR